MTAPKDLREAVDEFWSDVEEAAEKVRDLPTWMKAGLIVDNENFDATSGDMTRPASAEASSLRKPTIEERFANYHAANPHVYAELVRLAREAKSSGRNRVGAKELFEVCRWHLRLKTRGDEFGINNTFSSRYADLIQEQEPDLRGLFETRRRRSR